MKAIYRAIKESSNYKDTIMDEIKSVLSSKGIEFTVNKSNTEIFLPSYDINDLKEIINNIVIPNPVKIILLDLYATNGNCYIRLKMK